MATARPRTHVVEGEGEGAAIVPKLRHRRPLVRIGRRFNYWFTPAGKALTFCCFLAGAVGSMNVQIPIYHVAFALSGMWGASLVVTYVRRARVNAKWRLPDRGTAGVPATVQVDVTNEARGAAMQMEAGLSGTAARIEVQSATHAETILSGEQAQLSFAITPSRRGIYGPLIARVWTSFPFGIFRRTVAEKRWPVFIAYPNFTPIDDLDIPMGRRFQPGGIALTSGTGESPEYIGNREYRPGDPVRRIDFRAWARLAKPAVREYHEEYYCRVALLLDTYIAKGLREPSDGFPNFEAAISLCAAVSDSLARGEYILDLFAAGPELYVFRAGRSLAHFENVLEVLAGLEAHRDDPMAEVRPAMMDELAHTTTLITIVLDWDEAREAIVRNACEQGCAVKVIVVRDGDTTLPIGDDVDDVITVSPEDVFAGGVNAL